MSPTKVAVAADGTYGERYSIAVINLSRKLVLCFTKIRQFFAHPDHDKYMETLPTCWDTESKPKLYSAVKPGDWIENRLKTTYV